MSKINLTYVVSQVSHSKLFEWTAQLLDKSKYNLCFILMHESETPLEISLRKIGIKVYRVPYKNKYDLPATVIRIRNILKSEKTTIIHTHLFEGGLAGMSAAKLAGIKKRIHTRHDATIHHDFHPSAVKYDKVTNGLATDIIAITQNVKNILTNLEHVPESKISIIHHGFMLNEFSEVSEARINNISQRYYPSGKPKFIIGAVSRFIEWKGLHYLIPAFSEFLKLHPESHLVLANAQGPYETEINILLKSLPEGSFTKIRFENDIAALLHSFDVFIHVPVDERAEAFGQVYVEAMAAGIPSVLTLSGIAADFVIDNETALVVPFRNSVAILEKIELLFSNADLNLRIKTNAFNLVMENFQISKMISELEKCYDS
ncbi:glycosyltransferase [soil metagenome]